MSLSQKEVAEIARLAYLRIPEDRQAALAGELSHILDWIEQLHEVDTDDCEPMSSVIEAQAKTRDDTVDDGGKADEILANAPEAANGFFVVAKVLE